MTYSIVPRGSGREFDWGNDHVHVTTPYEVTDGRVTVVQDELRPGFLLARHHHRVMTEIFVILEGHVTFEFDDATVTVDPGTTVNVPPGVWHEVTSPGGARIITVFTPGGFDHYLAEMDEMDPARFDDAVLMTALAERYDVWHR